MQTYISHSSSSKNSIHYSMHKYICIRMAFQTHFMIYFNSTKNQISSFNKSMNIISITYSHNITSRSSFIPR